MSPPDFVQASSDPEKPATGHEHAENAKKERQPHTGK
jgi:hypothetical protein